MTDENTKAVDLAETTDDSAEEQTESTMTGEEFFAWCNTAQDEQLPF